MKKMKQFLIGFIGISLILSNFSLSTYAYELSDELHKTSTVQKNDCEKGIAVETISENKIEEDMADNSLEESMAEWVTLPQYKSNGYLGICNNGLGGISININAEPYTVMNYNNVAYSSVGCSWFASARAYELTNGKSGSTVWDGESWWNNGNGRNGLSTGQELKAPALACWDGHVAVIEKIDGDTVYRSDGGTRGYTAFGGNEAAYGYTIIRAVTKSEANMSSGDKFLGYVYLSESAGSESIQFWAIEDGITIKENKKIWAKRSGTDTNHYAVFYVDGNAVTGYLSADSDGFFSWELDISKYSVGKHTLEIYYAHTNGSSRDSITINIEKPTIVADTTAPVISNVKVIDVTNTGYTITCDVTDNVGVERVCFPSYTRLNGKDDLGDWYEDYVAEKPSSGNTYSFRVNISDHNNEGDVYLTDIWAFDAAGNSTFLETVTSATIDVTAPVISNVQVLDLSRDSYTITCDVIDDGGVATVCFPTWTEANGQDDIFVDWRNVTAVYAPTSGNAYVYRVNISEHNNEGGAYTTDIYAYDTVGNCSKVSIGAYVDVTPPTITNVQVSDISKEGYTVTCDVTDNCGVLRVCFPTWTEANGDDDIAEEWWNNVAVYSPTSGNTYSYRVNTAEHNNELGKYITHIYADDTVWNSSTQPTVVEVNIDIPLESITLNNRTLSIPINCCQQLAVASYTPSNTTTDKTVTWTSSDETVAIVQSDGTVVAKGVGRAIITAEVAGKTASCIVTVEPDEDNQQVACTHTSTKSTTTKASTSKDGKVVTKCTSCNEVISTTVIRKVSSIKLGTTTYVYSGKVRKPSVTVTDTNGKKLKNGTDYTVTYADGRKNAGKYNVKITLKGKYKGSKTLTFTIKPKSTSISKLTAKSKGFEIKWKKQNTQTTGYQIQYSTKSDFIGSTTKTITVNKNSTVNKSVSKLSAKKKYYVRIRTYKTVAVNGKSTKIYSDWSKAKTVTTKK